MRMVQSSNNGPKANGFAELNHDTPDELKEVRNGVTGQGQGLLEEDESQINEDSGDVNGEHMEVGQVKTHDQIVKQVLQKDSQGPSVEWERFLPLQSLKVLLAENDDSTRHVVSALLRNCGYEVTAVADGLQAWKVLEDITNQIDLVISEVVMPCLSGIRLLSKIMSHKTRKNIPVIMMSCHDSMNVVFKCLSKGAVDFLVKPIRKNELKNLWQHVWRRCHSSSGSGSGSESTVRITKSTKPKSAEDSDNQIGSNDEGDVGSIALNARNGSDNGSGTQSCWTERAVEVESPKPMSPRDDIAETPDSTCAQVIHSWPEEFGTNWVPTTATKGCEGQKDEFENIVMGKDLEIGVPTIPNMQLEDKSKMISTAANNGEKISERNLKKDDEQLDKGNLELNSEKLDGESRTQVADVMGVLTNSYSTDPQVKSAIIDISNNPSKPLDTKDKSVCEHKEVPSLELSLKRIREVEDKETAHERNILRHSAFSAFSRYNSASTANQCLTGNVGSCSPLDNSSEAAKTESMQNLQSNSNTTPSNQNGSSNNNDMGSTTNNAFSKPSVPDNELAHKSTVKRMQAGERSSAFQSARNEHMPLPPVKIDAMNANSNSEATHSNSTSELPGCPNKQVQVQHHHHHYYHHHHHVHNIAKQQQQQQITHQEELTLKNMATVAPHCGSSNMQSAQKLPDYNLNGNGSGSDQGSNGQNRSSRVTNTKGANMDNNDCVAGRSRINVGIMSGSRIGFDQNHVTQREAALSKFREKRKERCFEKKVRYHSRKKLAEQRPRIRGQFVRQVQENKEKDAHN